MILEERKVTFLEAVKDYWKGYFDFRGRSKRSGYWWAVLFRSLVYLVLGLIGLIGVAGKPDVSMVIGGAAFVVLGIFFLATIIPNLMLFDVGFPSMAVCGTNE